MQFSLGFASQREGQENRLKRHVFPQPRLGEETLSSMTPEISGDADHHKYGFPSIRARNLVLKTNVHLNSSGMMKVNNAFT